MFHFDLETLLYRIVAFVIAFSVHEWAHAYVAYRLGDPTAKGEGRLTLNPLPHIDPLGLLMILFGPFGWAKPVPVNPFHFRGNRRLGMVYVAAAGPLTNFILGLLFAKLFLWTQTSVAFTAWPAWAQTLAQGILGYGFVINAALFVFNLLPFAPLDGSKIVRYLLPSRFDPLFHKLEAYGPFLLLLVVLIPPIGRVILYPPFSWLQRWMLEIVA
ncbi:site-2 protease family protein [Bacillaceae bacterium]